MSFQNTLRREAQERLENKTLEELLDEISVLDDWDNDHSQLAKDGWYAVSTDEGIVAYFGTSAEAYKYRLDLINSIING